ncbi:LacI family transcriptional regulator [Candidatus Aerophobetes bacterium Ae_b3b]|nr:MAG: LacI family transcriptional regulator [Candidatus Aerophobetes bacterium Ae_b3b]
MDEITQDLFNKKKSISINDIAKYAGVSKSTVSRILNNKGKFSKDTRDKVLQVVKKLNYRPSMIAKSLRNRRTKAVGLLLPDIVNPFFPEIMKGVEDVASENGYVVILCSSNEDSEKEFMYFHMFENRWIDGIIYSGVTGTKEEAQNIRVILEQEIPVVLMDREIEDYFASVVMIDNEKAAYDATTYCLELGHKRIGFIAAPLKVKIFQKRLEGYRKALQKYGVEFDENLVVEGDLTIKRGSRASKELLARKDRPTVIFASNDLMAIGAMKEIQGHGLKVPENISIIGFDDIPTASLVTPALTTIAQPKNEMGVEAMNLLIRMIEKRGASKSKVVLDTQLMVRESTKRLI